MSSHGPQYTWHWIQKTVSSPLLGTYSARSISEMWLPTMEDVDVELIMVANSRFVSIACRCYSPSIRGSKRNSYE